MTARSEQAEEVADEARRYDLRAMYLMLLAGFFLGLLVARQDRQPVTAADWRTGSLERRIDRLELEAELRRRLAEEQHR